MKTIRSIAVLILVSLAVTACAAKAGASAPELQFDNPYAAQAGDGDLMRGEITIDSASVSVSDSKDIILDFAYVPPTPCYQLRVDASGPDAQGRIDLTAYGVAEKDKPCALMPLATPLQASLDLGTLPSGSYDLWLNGAEVGEFVI